MSIRSRIESNRAALTVEAERAKPTRPGMALTARVDSTERYIWTGTRRHGNQRAASDKGQNEWRTTSQNYRATATHDPAWDRTVSR